MTVTTTRTVVQVVEDGADVTVSTVSTPVVLEVAQMGPQGPPGPPGSGGGGSAEYPPGGATGAALVKASGADNDVEWHAVTAADVGADATGTAAAAVAAHVGDADPHPVYTTGAELTAALASYQPLDSDLTAIAALSTTTYGRAFLALADAAAARTALGLGTAATHAHGDYDAAGEAAAAQAAAIAASQPLDSDLTAIAALTTTSYGRAFLALADAAAGRSALGLGGAAVLNVGTSAGTVAAGDDSRMTNSRAPSGGASGDLTGTYPAPTIAARAVSWAKVAAVTATARILGRKTAGSGDVEELTAADVAAIVGGTSGTTLALGNHTHAGGTAGITRTGSGVPSNGTGVDGDWYIRSSNGALYLRVSGAYVIVGRVPSLAAANPTLAFDANFPSWYQVELNATTCTTFTGATTDGASATTLVSGVATRAIKGLTSWFAQYQVQTLPGAGKVLRLLGGVAVGGNSYPLVAITNSGGCTVATAGGSVYKTFSTVTADDYIAFSGGPGYVLVAHTDSSNAVIDFVFIPLYFLAPNALGSLGVLIGATGDGKVGDIVLDVA